MNKATIIQATENEILKLVNEHFGTNEDSIVAVQELGNEVWVIEVTPEHREMKSFITPNNTIRPFHFHEALNQLCFEGLLEEGEYNIDCTW